MLDPNSKRLTPHRRLSSVIKENAAGMKASSLSSPSSIERLAMRSSSNSIGKAFCSSAIRTSLTRAGWPFVSNVNIGKIVKSTSHINYVCQIYRPLEIETPPEVVDYAFGHFVRVAVVSRCSDPARERQAGGSPYE